MILDVFNCPTHSVLQHKASGAGTLHTAGRVWGTLGHFINYSRPARWEVDGGMFNWELRANPLLC